MKLSGQLGERHRKFFEQFVLPVTAKVEAELKTSPNGPKREAATRLYNDLSAIPASIMNLCQHPQVSSQAVLVLLRATLDGLISVLSFCRDPDACAKLYLDFPVVLDWRFVCLDEEHIGCPYVPDTQAERAKLAERKEYAKRNLLLVGLPYLNAKSKGDPVARLAEAVKAGNETREFFRKKWYKGTSLEILQGEKMGWLDDVLYKRLCSAVHSDSAAGMVFAGLHRGTAFTLALQIWGAGIYRLVEALRLRIPATQKGILHMSYMRLQE